MLYVIAMTGKLSASPRRCPLCYRFNGQGQDACEKCGEPRCPDQDRGELAATKVLYFFQALFVGLAWLALTASGFGVVACLTLMLVAWWAGLCMFAAHPVGGEFRLEHRYLQRCLASQTSTMARLAIRGAFSFLYWPIFISKRFYFWTILAAAAFLGALRYGSGK